MAVEAMWKKYSSRLSPCHVMKESGESMTRKLSRIFCLNKKIREIFPYEKTGSDLRAGVLHHQQEVLL
jgi:hypothetical protein